MNELASLLRSRRQELNLSLRGAAKIIGMSPVYLRVLEGSVNPGTGKPSQPTPEILGKIAKGYGINFYQLMSMAGHIDPLSPRVLAVLNDPRNSSFLETLADDPEGLADIVRIIKRYTKG
jgi:transcriptional regulator with XRE-family HTH domain